MRHACSDKTDRKWLTIAAAFVCAGTLCGLWVRVPGASLPRGPLAAPDPSASVRAGTTASARIAGFPRSSGLHTPSSADSGTSPTVGQGGQLRLATPDQTGLPYDVLSDELLIRPEADVSSKEVSRLAASLGSRVLEAGDRSGLFRLALPDGDRLDAFRARLLVTPGIADARPHAVATAAGCPSGDLRPRQWNLDLIGHGEACEDLPASLSAVVVAVLDTGIAYEHYVDGSLHYEAAPDLLQTPFEPGYDFVNNDAHPDDDHQHGTHIAAVIAANGRASGVASGVRLMPVKVLGSDRRGTELDVIEGIYFAVDHGADIINLSLAFGRGYFPSVELQAAMAYAIDHQVVVVGSAGNDGDWGVKYPAAFPDVISAGAARLANTAPDYPAKRASYSQRGFRLDLLAPGGMLNTDVNHDHVPDGILANTIAQGDPQSFGYWLYAGTSQAAAHVSGAAAWLLADGLAAADVRSTLQASAAELDRDAFDPLFGAGLLQLDAARAQVPHSDDSSAEQFYVNMVPRLVRAAENKTRAIVRLEVIDAHGVPAPDVLVGGSWFGSVLDFKANAVTGADGVVELSSPMVDNSLGVAIGFQVDILLAPGARYASSPFQFYSLSPAYAELYARLLSDPEAGHALMLYRLAPEDTALSSLFNQTGLVPTNVLKPVGAGLRSGPLVIAFDDRFAPDISQPAAENVSSITWTFPAPLYSGRGMVDSISGRLIRPASSQVGSARVLLLPFDPAMARLDLDHCYPVLNTYASIFLSTNRVFGNGFASSTMGDGFASSTMGDGFASSTMGDGFASSTMGDGFASSTMGDGFASSTMGDGFAASVLGTGFASSTMGDTFASSALGASVASAMFIGAYEAGGSSAADCDAHTMGDEGAESVEIEAYVVDPYTLITEEGEIPDPVLEEPDWQAPDVIEGDETGNE